MFDHFGGLALKGLKGTHLRENYFRTLTRVYFSVFTVNTKRFMAYFTFHKLFNRIKNAIRNCLRRSKEAEFYQSGGSSQKGSSEF